jgi:plastocyanin
VFTDMKRLSIAAAGVATFLALTACSSSSSPGGNATTPAASQPPATSQPAATTPPATSPAPAVGPKITITMQRGYTGSLTVKAGTKVTVVNEDITAHTLTDKQTGKFDTHNIDGDGGTGSFTAPDKPGSYPFGCIYHPEMAGTLVVTS